MAPLFAVAAIPLTIAVGSAVDVGRVMDTRSQLQDIADSAALAGLSASNGTPTATAQQFVTAAVATLAGSPTVTPTFNYNSSAGTLQVSLSTKIATTFTAFMTPSIATSVSATAQGSIVRNFVVTMSHFNSSAADLDQIYYYAIPSGLSGTSLYQWTPTSLPASNLLLSDAANFPNGTKTLQIPLGQTIGFALSNTTDGIYGSGPNCYGQAAGTTYTYYSHREDSLGSYWDYNVPSFTACTTGSANYWTATINSNGNMLLAPCDQQDASTVSQVGSCNSSQTYGTPGKTANYVYYTDSNPAYQPYDPLYGTAYSRNPLRFGSSNTDCTQGDVIYQWDDNGGSVDDNDYNDMAYTVNCQTTSVNKTTVHLTA